jgi:demethylmenaquinone methyltransferase/2-methoxy-6-polyprenyl-1,4-benzoquinol methylase
MGFSKQELRDLYRRRARRYDFTSRLYYFIGFRELAYRTRAVEALRLRPGDTVVELGCGTGLNFPLLENRVGPEGKIIGVDLTPEMLAQAKLRVQREGWSNVELVLSDAAQYEFPEHIDGIISTFALGLVPEYDAVIRRGAAALASGKRFAVADLKLPKGCLWQRLTPMLVPLVKPFGVTLDLTAAHPWESMEKYLKHFTLSEFFFGFTYVAAGVTGAADLRS